MAGLKFRVLLDSIDNTEIFRDILINDNVNFEQFYIAILGFFGLSNDQLASFFVSDIDWNKGEEISLLDMSFENYEEGNPPIEMNKLLLKEKIFSPKQRFILIHDFLSMWIFLIELLEITNQEVKQPQLILEIGKIPDELKTKGPKDIDDIRFESEINSDFDDFDDDDFENDQFENIDDFDI